MKKRNMTLMVLAFALAFFFVEPVFAASGADSDVGITFEGREPVSPDPKPTPTPTVPVETPNPKPKLPYTNRKLPQTGELSSTHFLTTIFGGLLFTLGFFFKRKNDDTEKQKARIY